MYEEIPPSSGKLPQELRSPSFVESKALVLSHDPGLELPIDIVSQREQGRTAETSMVGNPSPEERIDLFGDFSQRPGRLPRNVQAM